MALQNLKDTLTEHISSVQAFHVQAAKAYLSTLKAFRSSASLTAPESASHFCSLLADSWTNQNELLSTYLHDFRTQCMAIGNTVVKLSLFVNSVKSANLDGPEFSSLFEELEGQLRTLFGIFSKCMESSLSHPLFETLINGARAILNHVNETLSAIESRAPKRTIEGEAAMVLQLSEDLQKMPITNKIAYRRFVMTKCLAMKQTIEEFQGYLVESSQKKSELQASDAQSHGDGIDGQREVDDDNDEDEDDEDEDEEEQDYSDTEMQVVGQCVKLMSAGQATCKTVLQAITTVGDRLILEADASGTAKHSELFEWVARLAIAVDLIERGVVNLGAELYPPVAVSIDISQGSGDGPYFQLHHSILITISLLESSNWRSYLTSEEHARIEEVKEQLRLM